MTKRARVPSEEQSNKRCRGPVEKQTTPETPNIGSYVALKINAYKDWTPQIGEVVAINNSTVTINWLDGTYTSKWEYWKHRGKPVCQKFPRRAIVRPITFTSSMKLSKPTIILLKKDYDNEVEFV